MNDFKNKKKSVLLIVATAMTAILVSACSKGAENRPSAQQAPAQSTDSVQVNTQNTDTSVSTGTGSSEAVHVDAPYVDVNVNKGSGGIHINTPWVHINKDGHGAPTNVDVPSDSSSSN